MLIRVLLENDRGIQHFFWVGDLGKPAPVPEDKGCVPPTPKRRSAEVTSEDVGGSPYHLYWSWHESFPSKIQPIANIFYKVSEIEKYLIHFLFFSVFSFRNIMKRFVSVFITFVLNNFFKKSLHSLITWYQQSRWPFTNFSLVLNNWKDYKRSSTFSSVIIKHQRQAI